VAKLRRCLPMRPRGSAPHYSGVLVQYLVDGVPYRFEVAGGGDLAALQRDIYKHLLEQHAGLREQAHLSTTIVDALHNTFSGHGPPVELGELARP
jgi:hypothetical protein